jgi:hypothetical protein
MRLGRWSLVLTLLGLLAGAANSQTPVDPRVIVNGIGDPTCASNTDTADGCYSGQNPLTLTFEPSLQASFVYDGSSPLTKLILDFTMVPTGTFFQCASDIFSNCGFTFTGQAGVVEFDFFGDSPGVPGFCHANNDPTSHCINELVANDGFGVTVQPVVGDAPEPASMFLFGTGLILLAAKMRFGRPSRPTNICGESIRGDQQDLHV